MQKKSILFILFLLIGLSTSAQQSGNKRFAKWLWKDPGATFKTWGARELAGTAITGGGLLLLSKYDQSTTNYLKPNLEGSGYLKVTNEFGTINYVAPASAAIFGATLLGDNYKLQDAAFTSFQSVINTAVTVNIFKFVAARARPVENEGTQDFDFFEMGHTSFPSGHTSTAFALVVPWVVYYPNVATYALMAIPVSTGISRIVEGRHWLTDVTAGAIIGSYWGYTLAKRHKNQTAPKIAMAPYMLAEGGGINLTINF